MPVIRYVASVLLYLLMLPISTPAAFIGSTWTRPDDTNWGGWFGTYDNPPQGDKGFVRERAPFPGYTTGWRGYLNRCMWMIRNPLYGYARKAAVDYSPSLVVTHKGDESISDKYKRPGWYFAKAENLAGQIVAFEFYCVLPWGFGRCLRARLGWKIMTDKFQRYGFAQLVNTFNPFDGYGDD